MTAPSSLPPTPAPGPAETNLLGAETSPYLLQHRDNPVHWHPWGPAALERARREHRPILLSVGYAACHWCHVMAAESFENPEIARLMNEHYVCIKVDREERPDIDQIYQSALALLGQQGGWPLTMFLTPDGEPFWGGTYFPPGPRYGRPGFAEVLTGVAETWASNPAKIDRNVAALRQSLARLGDARTEGEITLPLIDHIAERLLGEVDPYLGGIGDAPKFPQPSIFFLLWRAWLRTGKTPFKTAVVNTLTHICQGGIYDHVGGGFARYSTDARWLVPHFEKMLYDNAQLIDLLTLVWQETRSALFETRIRETVAWLEREMISAGAFASTLDADSEHEEGKFYVWSAAELDTLLGTDSPRFKAAYGVRPEGNWEGANILNRSHQLQLGDAADEAALAGMRATLLAARAHRVRPGWDDKVLADWNGLIIAALANAGQVFGEPGWVASAARAFAFCRDQMTINGRLRHSWRKGQARHAATLDDYANLARAALALLEATGDRSYLTQAQDWIAILDRHYWDQDQGGYFFTADDAEALILRTRHAHDNAVPAGNGTVLAVLVQLWHRTGDDRYRSRGEALLRGFSGEATRNFFPLSTYFNSAEFLHRALDMVIIGAATDPDTIALIAPILDRSLPDRILSVIEPGAALPPNHPAAGKPMIDGRPTAYVCSAGTCSAPITDPAQLGVRLDRGDHP